LTRLKQKLISVRQFHKKCGNKE